MHITPKKDYTEEQEIVAHIENTIRGILSEPRAPEEMAKRLIELCNWAYTEGLQNATVMHKDFQKHAFLKALEAFCVAYIDTPVSDTRVHLTVYNQLSSSIAKELQIDHSITESLFPA